MYILQQDEYQVWKNSHKPGEYLGTAHDSFLCPLSVFLSTNTGVEYQVTYKSVDKDGLPINCWYEDFSTGEKRVLPQWAYDEMVENDRGRSYGDPIYKDE